ncbi:ABC transporter ATP-binding protein [Orrella marina]|uniref:Peptide ABC transporter ATP-binding protein n=1 Tax=Orrella marina TaxID=2163011 RepID=A0A2R4XK73_9BURK|nr:oligopeptide/dipeptide ABC transporter ATP-binding protein [Orrella marina]AWB34232.1 peptide ABC transporter ATP-binding protein [Orrella marina]
MSAPLLDMRSLARHYRVRSGGLFATAQTLRAVSDVSLQVQPGQTLGLVGESGCGKSTTARMSLGLTSPTSGEVVFDGERIPMQRDRRWKALRQQMQMVYQDPLSVLDRRISAVQQVIEPLAVFSRGDAVERRDRACAVLQEVGLSESLWQRYPHELSGGQRQRVVLARALVLEPRLLVCDEPISALDVSIQAQVINLLLDSRARHGLTMLFISHDLKVVRQICDEVAVMYLGRIVEQGPPQQLFASPAHPYTEALVSAIPTIRRGKQHQRILLQGDPPNPVNIPSGCAFHPRCPVAQQQCRESAPALRERPDGRKFACLLR